MRLHERSETREAPPSGDCAFSQPLRNDSDLFESEVVPLYELRVRIEDLYSLGRACVTRARGCGEARNKVSSAGIEVSSHFVPVLPLSVLFPKRKTARGEFALVHSDLLLSIQSFSIADFYRSLSWTIFMNTS